MESNLAYQEEWPEEMIGGKWFAMSPATTNHKTVADNLYFLFREHLKGKPCRPFGDGEAVYLTEEDCFIPDFMIVCDRSKIRSDGVHGAPDLVVEVLSPGTAKRDRGRKKDVYGRTGVREYWIVDPANRLVEQYINKNGTLELRETYALYPDWMLARMRPEEREAVVTSFRCSLYADLTIHLSDIFDELI